MTANGDETTVARLTLSFNSSLQRRPDWVVSTLTCLAQTLRSRTGKRQLRIWTPCSSFIIPTCFWSASGCGFHSPCQLCRAKLHHLLYV